MIYPNVPLLKSEIKMLLLKKCKPVYEYLISNTSIYDDNDNEYLIYVDYYKLFDILDIPCSDAKLRFEDKLLMSLKIIENLKKEELEAKMFLFRL